MKKLLAMLVVALGVGSLFAAQYTDEKGRTWTLSGENTTVSGESVTRWMITGCTPLPEGEFTVPAKLGNMSVWGVADEAFSGATNVTSVTVERGIKYLGFAFCTKDGQTKVLPSNIEKVTLPEGLEYIDCDAFQNSKIEREQASKGFVVNGYLIKYAGTDEAYTIPAVVKHICGTAFYYATNGTSCVLKNIVIPEGVETIQEGAFDLLRNGTLHFEFGDVVLPDSLKSIGKNAFGNATFKSLKLGKGITDLKKVDVDSNGNDVSFWGAFQNSNGTRAAFESLDFGDGVESIPGLLFSNKTTLKSVRFGTGLRVIWYSAFDTCTQLTNVDFTAATALESIGSSAFCRTGLSSIDLSKCTMLKEIPYCCFYGCSALREVTFNVGLETIGNRAFDSYHSYNSSKGFNSSEGFNALGSLRFPKSLKTIGDYAFYGSTNLSEIVLNDGLETIGSDAFGFPGWGDYAKFANSMLTNVVIPASVTTLGSGVFSSCTNLWDITGGEGVVDFDGYFGYRVPAFACEEFDKDGKTPLPFKVLKFGKTALGFQGPCKSALTAEDFGDINTIREEAFNGEGNASVSNLVSVAFPAGLEIIGEGAFAYAENLATVDFGANVTNVSIMSCAFVDTAIAELKGDFRMIGEMAFAQCEKLANVDVSVIAVNGDGGDDPEEPRSGVIYSGAFSECTNLQTVVLKAYAIDRLWIEDGERYFSVYGGWICDEVLSACPALKQVEIEADGDGEYVGQVFGGDYDALTSVKLNMPVVTDLCNGLTNLTAVTLGTLVEYIGANAFNGCSNLVTVAQAEGGELKQIDEYAFLGTKFYNEAPAGALKLGSMLVKWTGDEETVTIPEGIEYIASSAFIGSKAVKVIVPAKVGVIRPYTFEKCPNLAKVEFKNREILLSVKYDDENSVCRCTWYFECPSLAAQEEEMKIDECSSYMIPVKVLQVPNRGAFILAGWKPFGEDYIMPNYTKLAFHNDASADGDFVPGSSYTGWIMNNANAIIGTVTVKTGKLDKNNEVKVTMTVQLAGVKKNYTAMFEIDENGKAVATDAAANQFSELAGMYLGGTWLSGKVSLANQSYRVRGANSGKDVLAGMDGFSGHVWGSVLWSGLGSDLVPVTKGYSALSISVAKKGKVKVSGTLADGQKISATAQMAAGDNGVFAAPFYVQTNGKKGGFGFVLDFYMDGESPRAWFEEYDDGVATMTNWQYPREFGVDNEEDAATFAWVDLYPSFAGELFEIDPKGNGLAEGWHAIRCGLSENGAAKEALNVACKSPFVFASQDAELTVNAKGKWTFAKATKVALATEKDLEKYQSDIDAALKAREELESGDWFWCKTSDGKELEAYDFDFDKLLYKYTPTAYMLYDYGSKVKDGEVIEGKNTNYCAMKLSYAKKTGLVSGSALYYWVDISNADKPKLKKGKTSISGIVLDGAIYGASTAKGVASGSIVSYKMEE